MMILAPAGSDDSHLDTIIVLPEPTSAIAIADACREAVTMFVEQAPGWGKAELAMWLMGPYAALAKHAEKLGPRQAEPGRPGSLLRDLDVDRIQSVIGRAHAEVVDTMDRVRTTDGAADFGLTMFSFGFVARFQDHSRGIGWLPTNRARRLADRVLSLVAADYLTRPEDYAPRPSAFVGCTSRLPFADGVPPGDCDDHSDDGDDDESGDFPRMTAPPRSATIPYWLGES